ncbi:hypothetical protein [Hyalangium versicolor]|uniref:hypothetical protein n=1 Tax=Hyalangium versicolor TaxID=2861190 RepID=UPI001CCA60C1|nr:hypothetical protein [Hyalangium versicolor]
MNAETPQDPRSQLERLQERLATRQSILHFAHSAISFIVALIFSGAAAKLFWDSTKLPVLAFGATTLALALATYALVRYLKGRRELAEELKRYGDLLELRRQLNLDNPSTLLPR